MIVLIIFAIVLVVLLLNTKWEKHDFKEISRKTYIMFSDEIILVCQKCGKKIKIGGI